MKDDKIILSMLVHNESGVLTKVSGLFARRGFNINSLSVGETLDPNISRITIVSSGDEYTYDQIIKQLEKLQDVIVVKNMELGKTVLREQILVKVLVTQANRSEILEAISIFRAKVIDFTPKSLTIEITGEKTKCDAFLEYLKEYGIAELCRTGATAIIRGSDTINTGI